MQYSFDCAQLMASDITNLLYCYVLLINQQFLIFHDVTVVIILHVCLFDIFSLHAYFQGLQTFVFIK